MIEVIHTPKMGDNSEISKPLQPFWPEYMEKKFVELMVKEIEINFCLNNKGFKRIGDKLAERTCMCYSYSQLKDRFNQLRIRYHDYHKLLKKHGLLGNNLLTSTETSSEAYEDLRRSRDKLCPMFNELECIFEEYDKTCYQYSPNHSKEADDVESDCKNRAIVDEYGSSSQEVRMKAKRSIEGAEITTPSTAKKLKDSTENVGGNSESAGFSITNCVKFLESIEGVDSDTYVKAITMFKDADWREMFMAMSGRRRLDWLASLK